MREARWARRLAALTVVVAMGSAGGAAVGASASTDSPRGRYIVVLRDSVSAPGSVAAEHARADGVDVDHVYRYALKGYAGTMSAAAAENISHDPRVDHVESDQTVSIAAQTVPTGVRRALETSNSTVDIDGADDLRVDVDVAVIDTGVTSSHPDLNVAGGVDCTGNPFNDVCVAVASPVDGNGHGTHVAGTIGALDNGIGVVGVAPGARITSVRVLNSSGSGYMSWIIAGIDWVAGSSATIEVANMSLGCECSSSGMDTAISNAVSKGVVFAVAAGNNDANASTFSPANHPDVITVSALADFNGLAGGGAASTCRTDQDDTLADFSNWGSTVEIAAPGVCILSTWNDGGYNTISGTSMASPHVAGAAALLASRNNPNTKADVQGIRSTLVNNGNFDWTDDSGDNVKEPLLDLHSSSVFNPVLVAGPGSTNAAPTAGFTQTCSALTCNFTDTSSDTDGTIASRSWNFGDGSTSTATNPSHTYASGATYTVSLTVTDNGGASNTTSHTVTVSDSSSSGIQLTARGYKVKGVQTVDLGWTGTTGTSVGVYRNNAVITTTSASSYTDNLNRKGAGSYTYKVCLASSPSTCSNTVTVTF